MNLRYVPLQQKPYCCVPACLSMILKRRGLEVPPQEEIGYKLGLVVPDEKAPLFTKVRIGKKSRAGWGTQIYLDEYSINNFFNQKGIPLEFNYYFPEEIKDVSQFIKTNLEKDNDLIVCFHYKNLYGKGNEGGHVSLINNLEGESLTLIDPNEKDSLIKEVYLTKLINSMTYHGKDKSGGFWIISKKN